MNEKIAPTRIEVLWRPGCPYCSRLRSGLRRAGIETVEHDIWADPSAAARVRRATGGDETVPTVVVGSRALVNPSVSQVVSAVHAEFPDQADTSVPRRPVADRCVPGRSGPPRSRWCGWRWRCAADYWHLAPVLLAAVWPWVTGQDLRGGDRSGRLRLLASGAAGIAAAVVTTLALSRFDLLRGPTVLGFPDPAVESLVLGAAGGLAVVLLGVGRTRRSAVSRSAWVGSTRVAASEDVVLVEGNAYFPASSVLPGVLVPSSTTSVCPWKGLARYYTLRVDGHDLPDAAWTYPHPLPFARRIKGRIAFWGAVEVRSE